MTPHEFMASKKLMKGYCTWLPAMMDVLLRTDGPVLELGGGHGTLLLRNFCEGVRPLLTVENDPDYFEVLSHLKSNYHKIKKEIPEVGFWDVALVDSAPAASRQPYIEALRSRAKFIVVHDVQDPGYGYDFRGFVHVAMWDDLCPATAVLTTGL